MNAARTDADGSGVFDELIGLNKQRVNTYAMLSRMYAKEIDADYLEALRAVRWPVETGNEDADEGYRLLATFLSNTWIGTVDDLAADYVRCFLGKGKNGYSCAYPYESVNRSEKRLLRQDERDQVLAIYRSQGLDKREGFKEEEDHIAVELEFMQVMAARTTRALERGEEDRAGELFGVQREFMDEHLGVWTPNFTADLRKFAKTGFYQALASLTDGFLTTDKEFLRGLVARA